jgi:hypothetical protein
MACEIELRSSVRDGPPSAAPRIGHGAGRPCEMDSLSCARWTFVDADLADALRVAVALGRVVHERDAHGPGRRLKRAWSFVSCEQGETKALLAATGALQDGRAGGGGRTHLAGVRQPGGCQNRH